MRYRHRLVELRDTERLLVVLDNTTHLHLCELVKAPSQPTHALVLNFSLMPVEVGWAGSWRVARCHRSSSVRRDLHPRFRAPDGDQCHLQSRRRPHRQVVHLETPPFLTDRKREVTGLRTLCKVDHGIQLRNEAMRSYCSHTRRADARH